VPVPVVASDSVVAADGGVYARAAIKSWIEECLQGTCATALAQRAEGSTASSFLYIPVKQGIGVVIAVLMDVCGCRLMCVAEDGVMVSPLTGHVMSSTVLLPACTVAA
jgi:hypothetical protein